MKIYSLLLLISVSFITASGQELDKQHRQIVLDFIQAVKNQNKEKLAVNTAYPLMRLYPVPAVKDQKDFISRYKELFDDKLAMMIINSNPSQDWHAAGWRGIMLFNGAIWLAYDGKLTAINHKTDAESKRRTALIEADRNLLHSSIRVFESPKAVLETKTLRIRIDDLGA